MPDAWEFYFTDVNDRPGSIFVNLGLRDVVPDRQRPWLLRCSVEFNRPRDDGLSGSDEAPTLYQIEDALAQRVEKASSGVLVGRVTAAGRREFYFYGRQSDGFDHAVSEAMKAFPEYTYDCGAKEDYGWRQYLDVLYPTPVQRERIRNRHAVEALKAEGDVLRTARPVSHWAYFKTKDDRRRFVDQVTARGFKIIEEQDIDESGRARAAGVMLERVDTLDFDSIDDVTLYLYGLAAELDGEYDGWETQVQE